MLEEANDGDEKMIVLDLQVEFYLKARAEPVQAFVTYRIKAQHLDPGDEVMDFMNIVTASLLNDLDKSSAHLLILSDRRWNKQVIFQDQIQSISLLAPDNDKILELINAE